MASRNSRAPIYEKLSGDIIKRSGDLIGINTDLKWDEDKSKEKFQELLEGLVPENDKDEVKFELRKACNLTAKATLKFKKKTTCTHRGKKKLSSKQKRSLGLNKINKFNKTFEMFVPLNEMWKSYASELLNIGHLKQNGWCGDNSDNRTEVVQTKLKKIDYFGSLIRVTKSKSSGIIGMTGIVVKETKNTFFIIGVDDKVRVIPKTHSEFSYVISGIGFSILGNHLIQTPANRAKQSLKKQHCLWL